MNILSKSTTHVTDQLLWRTISPWDIANHVTKMTREFPWGLQIKLLQTQGLYQPVYPKLWLMVVFNSSQFNVFQEKPVCGEIGQDAIRLSSESEISWLKWKTYLIIFLVLMGIYFFY